MKTVVATTTAAAAAVAAAVVAFAASGASATMLTPAITSCGSHGVGGTSPTTPRRNRWVSKALAVRGGADSAGAAADGGDEAEGMAGMLSPVQVAVTPFRDLLGDKLLTVDNPKKGTTKEVGRSPLCYILFPLILILSVCVRMSVGMRS